MRPEPPFGQARTPRRDSTATPADAGRLASMSLEIGPGRDRTVEKEQRYTPGRGLQELLPPLPGRIRLLQYSGGSLCSPPAKLPAPFQGAPACLENTLPCPIS